MSDTAPILIDIQNDYFENGNWPVAKMLEVSNNAARLLAHARDKGYTVIHIRHEIPSDGRSWTAAKTKDDEGNISQDFYLKSYVVDYDEDGLEVTSCAIERTTNEAHKPLKKVTGKHQIVCMVKEGVAGNAS
jgi:nicotinamidase-related amidase